MKIFTWNVHGGYMSMLAKLKHDFYVPVKEDKSYGYDGKTIGYYWGDNVHEILTSDIKNYDYDLIIYQSYHLIKAEQFNCLTEKQRKVPKIFIVHSPLEYPVTAYTKGSKIKDIMVTVEKELLNTIDAIVHVSNFTLGQWNIVCPKIKSKSTVIYHAIDVDNNVECNYTKQKAITVINNLYQRQECGLDVYTKVKKFIDIDLYGSNGDKLGGYQSIMNDKLRKVLSEYRVYFNPTVNSSFPMSLLEAMSVGLPIISTASADITKIIKNGISGFITNDVDILISKLKYLLNNKEIAKEMGAEAQKIIKDKFNFCIFKDSWDNIFRFAKKEV